MNPILRDWTPPPRPTQPRLPGAAVTRLNLVGEITVENSIPLFHAIRAAHADSIEIQIDSGGGNALCALGLFELLIEHPHRVVATIVGRASSGALTAAMGADLRRIAPGARLLVHEARASLKDVTAEVLRETLIDLAAVDAMSVAILAAATGRPPQQVATWEGEGMTFDAHGAIAVGLAHEFA